MERRRLRRILSRYDRRQMDTPVTHPLDAALRKHLRALKPNQKELAKRIGRSQGWMNKYLNGVGKATLDDIIRLVAILVLRVESPPLTVEQRRLLRDWETLSPSARKHVKALVAAWSGRRPEPRSKPPARSEQKNHGTAGKAPGTR